VAAGLCQAAVEALRKQNRDVGDKVLAMFSTFCASLSKESLSAAIAVLVEAGAVELTVGHMTEAGLEIPVYGLQVYSYYIHDPGARDRMCAPGVVDQLMKWFAKWLPEVGGNPFSKG
jgi:hypothetical protein